MKVRANRQCDAIIAGERRALWPGQVYDFAPAVLQPLVDSGNVSLLTKAVEAAPENKAVEEAPENKAVSGPPRAKRKRRHARP